MDHLQSSFSVSERRACRVVQQHRTSQRHVPEKADEDTALSQRMVELSRENPRYGYRRVWALLRREGWAVNKKRVQRLWREVDLKVPQKQHKRQRIAGSGENSVTKKRAEYPGHVWSYDFAMDSTEDGRRLKLMPVVEEYTRECLALPTQRSITSEQVIQTLAYLFAERGAPDYIRSDNGPEFIAEAVKAWLANSGVKTLYIEPGSVGERVFGDLHKPNERRTIEQGGVCQCSGGEGTDRRLPRTLQPPQAARGAVVHEPGGVCGGRSSAGSGS